MNSFNPLSAYNLKYTNKDALASPLSIHTFKNLVVMLGVILEEPLMDNLKLFRDKLLDKAREVEFKDSYNFKPSFVSYEFFGDVNLGYLIMYINDFYCKREFVNKRKNTLLIPDKDAVLSLYKFQQQNNKVISRVVTPDETTLYKL